MTTIKKEISSRLAELLIYLITEGIIKDQNQFSDQTGISRGNLSEIKTGKRGLPIEKAVEICYLYGISANWLLLGRGNMLFNEDENLMAELLARVSEIQKELKSREKNGKTFAGNRPLSKKPTSKNQ